MYKNQLQELAQRSCFNLPSYTCVREGPDHAPRFKATVTFNGESFDSPHYCSTLRQAEHSAAEVALISLSSRGPSHSLAARILDETGVYKNLLQEIAQRVGAPLPQYTTFRSGLGHQPVFTGTVELAGITFTGEPAKNKKQAEKNAAMAAWSSLKQLAKEDASSSSEQETNDELEQITVARALLNYRWKEKMAMATSSNAPIPFTKKFPIQSPRPTSPQHHPPTTSKILPLISPKTSSRNRLIVNDRSVPSRPTSVVLNDKPVPARAPSAISNDRPLVPPQVHSLELRFSRPQKFPAAGAAPYIPIRQYGASCKGIAPPVTIRTAVPVFSAPPLPPPSTLTPQGTRAPAACAPPVNIRQAVPVSSISTPVLKEDSSIILEEPLNLPKDLLDISEDYPPTSVASASKLRAFIEECMGNKSTFPPSVAPIPRSMQPCTPLARAPPVNIRQAVSVPSVSAPVRGEDSPIIPDESLNLPKDLLDISEDYPPSSVATVSKSRAFPDECKGNKSMFPPSAAPIHRSFQPCTPPLTRAPPVTIRHAVTTYAAPQTARIQLPSTVQDPLHVSNFDPPTITNKVAAAQVREQGITIVHKSSESNTLESLEQLKI